MTCLKTKASFISHSINLIDKSRLHGDAYEYSGSSLVWKARLFLFLGFALIAGGFAGSFVSETAEKKNDEILVLAQCIICLSIVLYAILFYCSAC